MNTRHLRIHRPRSAGFTLVELLVVLGIMGILTAMALPSLRYITRDMTLTTAGNMVRDGLDLARQTAATKNSTVEMRFYQLPDSGSSTPSNYRAFQLFLKSDATIPVYTAVTPVTYLPAPIIMSTDSSKTTFLTLSGQPASGAAPPSGAQAFSLPGCGTNYNYLYFCFKSNGQTDLDATLKWFVTLVPQNGPVASSGVPANFATVQIDPVIGRSSVFRP